MYKGSQDFIDKINNQVQKHNLLNDEKTRKIINRIKDIYNENNFLDEDTLKK
ncbi:hypothetical protein [Apilactobacillus timberlakei]|uniref:hypothetical protein n=1 Tax=Apilactobacillus timberlakei TaxID=2008380 RepID=UPI0015E87454|nr:hypothetical protein [Apilactobacillus timberlakei]